MSLLAQHTALYTALDLEYAQALSGPYTNCGCKVDDFIAVAARQDGRVTGYWRPVVAFGPDGLQLAWIEQLWQNWSQDICYQDFLLDGRLSVISKFLLSKNYAATPYCTQVIDLGRSVDELRCDLRKSYHSLVNKQADVWHCSVADVRAIHLQKRGVTRPAATWEIQEKMDTVCCADGERCAVMFYYGATWAYYACGAGENAHASIWAALLALKDKGVRYVEMGEQKYAGDEKLMNISKLKRGFGGETRVRLIFRKGQDDEQGIT